VASELKLAEMLCTRLCHDLAGPVGAVNNGVEFLQEDDAEMREQAVGLIASSAEQAVAKLMFYRNLFGRINFGGEANLESLREICANFLGGSKINLDWPDSHTDSSKVSISRKMGRLLLNIVLITSNSLIKGGKVEIRLGEESGNRLVTVTAIGPSVKVEDIKLKILSDGGSEEDLEPKTSEFFLTYILAKDLETKLIVNKSDDTFEIIAKNKLNNF
jgi:histidine phosphotransferase ChpT